MPIELGIFIVVISGIGLSFFEKLLSHSRQMAEISASKGQTGSLETKVDALTTEVQELRALVHEQSIAMDTVTHIARQNVHH